MPIDNQLYTASFRGIKFLVNRSSVAGGRKTVTHEFIDSDRRFVQDQGLLNRTFTVNAIIHEVSYTYFAQRDNLLLALEEEGPGLLVHPFYGTQTVNVTSFTLDENTSSVGRADFNIVFEESQPNDSPTAITNNLSAILDLTNQVVGQVNADIATGYGVSSIYPNNFTDAENTLNNISSTFAVVTDQTMTDVEATEEFDQSVNEFSDDTTELVSDPTQLGSRLNDLWLQSNELVADPSDAVTYL
jgi:prophage DNA circulation protein